MKVFITGSYSIDKQLVSEGLYNIRPSEYIISKQFSTDESKELKINENDINLGYKNNSFLFISLNKETQHFYGVTLDEFSKSNIIPIELDEFNSISECVLENNDILVVWIDSNKKTKDKKKDIIESKFLQERINYAKLKYLYFYKESESTIIKTIDEYIQNKELRNKLLEQFC